VAGSSPLCIATYAAAVSVADDLGILQGNTLSVDRATENFAIDLATARGDVQTAYNDSLLTTFETAAQGACRGTQTMRNDANAVRNDIAIFGGDVATFSAESLEIPRRIRMLRASAASLRRDIAAAEYTPPGTPSDLTRLASATATARSGLALARSIVGGDVQTATELSAQANGYFAAAQTACDHLRR
jgi:hypothetical protein